MLKLRNICGKKWNNKITVSFILSCNMRTGSHWFSRCWLLLSIFSLKICVCWLFESSNRTTIVVITQIIWIYFIWRALRNWHTRNFIKHCVLLWFCSIQQDNTDNFVQKQVSVILPIQSFLILKQSTQSLENVPLRVKNCIHAINMFDSDYIMSLSGHT